MFEDLDTLFDNFLKPSLDWDKNSYSFNREEKDMHPYTVKMTDKECVITHNILGIDKKDIKLTREKENGTSYILISGKTEDKITGNTYSVNSKFALDDTQLDLSTISASAANGLLYITIATKKPEKKVSKEIEII